MITYSTKGLGEEVISNWQSILGLINAEKQQKSAHISITCAYFGAELPHALLLPLSFLELQHKENCIHI